MRDPARIPVMLVALGELWAKHPDWRLGQLLLNAADRPDLGRSLFYIEDDQLLRGIIALDERVSAVADGEQLDVRPATAGADEHQDDADEQQGEPQRQGADGGGDEDDGEDH